MSVIMKSLISLENAVDSLEGGVEAIEKTLTGQQRDMFGKVPQPESGAKATKAPARTNVKNKLTVQKFDKMISKVEKMLEDA